MTVEALHSRYSKTWFCKYCFFASTAVQIDQAARPSHDYMHNSTRTSLITYARACSALRWP